MEAYFLVKEHKQGYLKNKMVEYIGGVPYPEFTDNVRNAEYFTSYFEAENSIRSLLTIHIKTSIYKIVKIYSE